MKSSLNDVSSSVSSSIDNQKSELKIRDENKKIDREAKIIGDVVVRCLEEGVEFDPSMVSEQMAAIIESKRVIAELRGEYFESNYDNGLKEPEQTVVSIPVTPMDPKPVPPKEEPAEETVQEDVPDTEIIVEEVVEEEIEDTPAETVEDVTPETDTADEAVVKEIEEPAEEEAVEIVEEEPEVDVAERIDQPPNRMSGRYRTLMEAAIDASAYCSKWRFQDEGDETYNADSLVRMAEKYDSENTLDDDSAYVVLEDGSIGERSDGGAAEWLFIPTDTDDSMRASFDSTVEKNGKTAIGFSKIYDRCEGIWSGTVLDRGSDLGFTAEGEEHQVYWTSIRRSDGSVFTVQEVDVNPMYLWLSKGDQVRYIPSVDRFEKYDKSIDVTIPCLECGFMNDMSSEICSKCEKPLPK